jgi:hypothetical protein
MSLRTIILLGLFEKYFTADGVEILFLERTAGLKLESPAKGAFPEPPALARPNS